MDVNGASSKMEGNDKNAQNIDSEMSKESNICSKDNESGKMADEDMEYHIEINIDIADQTHEHNDQTQDDDKTSEPIEQCEQDEQIVQGDKTTEQDKSHDQDDKTPEQDDKAHEQDEQDKTPGQDDKTQRQENQSPENIENNMTNEHLDNNEANMQDASEKNQNEGDGMDTTIKKELEHDNEDMMGHSGVNTKAVDTPEGNTNTQDIVVSVKSEQGSSDSDPVLEANKNTGGNNKTSSVSSEQPSDEQSGTESDQQTVSIKSEGNEGTLSLKIQNCVHFDPKEITGSGDKQKEANQATETVQVKTETITVKEEPVRKISAKSSGSKADDVIELSSSDSEVEEVEHYQPTMVLNASDLNFGSTSRSSPVQIDDDDDDDESDAELCIDLVDSDDDVEEEGGVWKYGKDISTKKGKSVAQSGAQSKRPLSTFASGPNKRRIITESSGGVSGLKIVSTCTTTTDWEKDDVPLHRKIAITTIPRSNAGGLRLPSIESRINAGVQKVSLKEIPKATREKLLKKEIKRDAEIKLEYHKHLGKSIQNPLLKTVEAEKETLIQCLSDEDAEDEECPSDEDASTNDKISFPCKQCNIIFTTTKSFKKHTCVSGNKQPGLFSCTECGKRFDSKGHLMNHLPTHDQVKNKRKFTCRVCHIVFNSRSMQTEHERQYHPDEMTFACQHCDKTFKTRTARAAHEKVERHGAWHAIPNQDMIDLTANISVGEYTQFPHRCTVCKRAFSRGSSLMHHFASASHRDKIKVIEAKKESAEKRKEQRSGQKGSQIKMEDNSEDSSH